MESEHQARRTKALRRVVILRDSLADDRAELNALEEAPATAAPAAQTRRARADLLRDRVERRGRELAVRRDEYQDHGGSHGRADRARR